MITGVSLDKGIFRSYNYGQSFENVFPNVGFGFEDVAVNSEGIFQYAVANDDYAYRSNDSGSTWSVMQTAIPPVTELWNAVATSGNGSCVYAGKHLQTVLAVTLLISYVLIYIGRSCLHGSYVLFSRLWRYLDAV